MATKEIKIMDEVEPFPRACERCQYWEERPDLISKGIGKQPDIGRSTPDVCRRYPGEIETPGHSWCWEFKKKENGK